MVILNDHRDDDDDDDDDASDANDAFTVGTNCSVSSSMGAATVASISFEISLEN